MDDATAEPLPNLQLFVNGFRLPFEARVDDELAVTPTNQAAFGYLTARFRGSALDGLVIDFLSHDQPKFEPFYAFRIRLIYEPRQMLFALTLPWDGPLKHPRDYQVKYNMLHAALDQIAATPEASEKVWRGEVAKLDAATDQELFDWMLAASAEDYHKARTPAAKARAVLLLSIDGPFYAPAYVWKDGKTTRYAVTLENEAKVRLAGFDEKGRFVMGGWVYLDADAPEKDRWAALGDLLGVDFAHPVPAPATAAATGPTTAAATGPSTIPTTRAAAATPARRRRRFLRAARQVSKSVEPLVSFVFCKGMRR